MFRVRSGLLGACALLASCTVDDSSEPTAADAALAWGVAVESVDIANGKVTHLVRAILDANASGQPRTIRLAPGGLYVLSGQAGRVADEPPDLFCQGPVGLPTVTGLITIDGRGAVIERAPGQDDLRIFHVIKRAHLTLRHVTLRGGQLSGKTQYGAGICSTGTLIVDRSSLLSHRAESGAALTNVGGFGDIIDSTIARNEAVASGGGILNLFGSLALRRTTLSENNALTEAGFSNTGGTARITNSTISSNRAVFACGGLCNRDDVRPGAVLVATVLVASSTITGNHAGGVGGGVRNSGSLLALRNTIVAGNTSGAGSGPDCAGTIGSHGYNLLGRDSGCDFRARGMTDQVGMLSALDPGLEPLADNGGQTQTHALRADSRAIDRANPLGCVSADGIALRQDQRLQPRVRDGDGDGHAVCDVGAVEHSRERDGDPDTDETGDESQQSDEGDKDQTSDESQQSDEG